MNSFLDTNVIIGYIFALDKLNDNAELFMANDQHIFCSSFVKNEVELIFKVKLRQFQLFLLNLSNKLDDYSDNELLNEYIFHKFIDSLNSLDKLDVGEMHTSVNKIWKNLEFNENHDAFDVKHKFDIYQNEFNSLHFSKKLEIYNKMTLVSNHSKKDKKVLNRIIDENLREFLHKNDERILFDADEFSRNNPNLNLQFVSADVNFIKTIQILIDDLGFDKYVNLCEFTSCS